MLDLSKKRYILPQPNIYVSVCAVTFAIVKFCFWILQLPGYFIWTSCTSENPSSKAIEAKTYFPGFTTARACIRHQKNSLCSYPILFHTIYPRKKVHFFFFFNFFLLYFSPFMHVAKICFRSESICRHKEISTSVSSRFQILPLPYPAFYVMFSSFPNVLSLFLSFLFLSDLRSKYIYPLVFSLHFYTYSNARAYIYIY